MQRFDILLVASLVVAAGASAVGVLTYEDDRLADFVVTWTTRESSASFEPLGLAGAGEGESVLNVTERNLTRATVTVTLTGGAARVAATSYRVELVVPSVAETIVAEGTLPAGPGGAVDVPLEVTLAEAPTQETVRAASVDDAMATLADGFGSEAGVGEWVLRVAVSPGAPGPLAESVTASAVADLVSFEAQVAAQVPEVGR